MLCCIGYVVEKCEDGTDFWEKVPGAIPSSKNSHVVKDLEPGKKYKFRVKAENKFGPGQPVETNTAILAKNPYGDFTALCHYASVVYKCWTRTNLKTWRKLCGSDDDKL